MYTRDFRWHTVEVVYYLLSFSAQSCFSFNQGINLAGFTPQKLSLLWWVVAKSLLTSFKFPLLLCHWASWNLPHTCSSGVIWGCGQSFHVHFGSLLWLPPFWDVLSHSLSAVAALNAIWWFCKLVSMVFPYWILVALYCIDWSALRQKSYKGTSPEKKNCCPLQFLPASGHCLVPSSSVFPPSRIYHCFL